MLDPIDAISDLAVNNVKVRVRVEKDLQLLLELVPLVVAVATVQYL